MFSDSLGLSEVDSYRVPYFVDAGFAAVSALLVAFGIKERKVETERNPEEGVNPIRIKVLGAYKVLLIVAFVTGLGEGFIRPLVALFFNDVHGAEPVTIGVMMTLTGFIQLLASWTAGRASDRFGRKGVIALGGIPSRLFGAAIPLGPDLGTASLFYSFRGFTWSVYGVKGECILYPDGKRMMIRSPNSRRGEQL